MRRRAIRRTGYGHSALVLSVLIIGSVAFAAPERSRGDAAAGPRDLARPEAPVVAVDGTTPATTLGEGDGAALPKAAVDERTVSYRALAHALAYAKTMNSHGLIVAHRGVIQLEYYESGLGPDRLLDSQSLDEPLAVLVTMAAVADGDLALDDPLSRFLPEWPRDARGAISVRDVLAMQNGLTVPAYEQGGESPGRRLPSTSRRREAVLAMQRESPPGGYHRPHHAATQLLQRVLEAATGERYADVLNERLWVPLEAGEARLRRDRPGAPRFCCLQARPRDWLRVGLMLSQHGQYTGETVLPFGEFMQLTRPPALSDGDAMPQRSRGSSDAALRGSGNRDPERALPRAAPFTTDDVIYLEGRGGQRVYAVPSRELVVVRQGEPRAEWDDAAFLNGLLEGTPEERAYSALLAPPEPDYRRDASWARRPDGGSRGEGPAAFYVHPSTYAGSERWNAPYHSPAIDPGVRAVVLGQASVLEACCELWAPRYRQGSFASLRDAPQAFELAFLDVRSAFEQFLSAIGNRPFVILGHSQGALHSQNLVIQVVDKDPALAERMIAAYILGIPVPEALYTTRLSRVTACERARGVGCIASWASYAPDYAGLERWRELARKRYADVIREAGSGGIQCTNPLNWTADGTPADASENLGAALVTEAGEGLIDPVPALVGARCERGALLVSPPPPPPFRELEMTAGSYHFLDVALFYRNLQRNLAARVAAWYGT